MRDGELTEPDELPLRRGRSVVVRWLLGLAIGAVAVWVVLAAGGWLGDSWYAIRAMDVWWLGPALVVASEYGAAVKIVKVDVDANSEVAARYGIRGIPTIALFEAGELTGEVVGARPRQAIEQELGLSRFRATV